MAKEPLKPGDIIRFSGPLSVTPKAEPGYFARKRRARILNLCDPALPGELEIITEDAGDRGRKGCISVRQVTHRIRKKPLPPEKEARLELWHVISARPDGTRYSVTAHDRKGAVEQIGERTRMKVYRMLEIREGERILSKADLEKAMEQLHRELQFIPPRGEWSKMRMAELLGFPTPTPPEPKAKGEGERK